MKVSFESKGDFEKVTKWLKDLTTRKPTQSLNQIANDGRMSLSANTPKDTGETASGWIAEVKTKGSVSEISWKNVAHPEVGVNLAKLIDLGHGTGTGGYVPPQPYIKDAMKPVFRTAGDKVAEELIK